MSGLLAGKVWESALRRDLKPLCAALADIANNDGTRIYPSVAYLAWLLGCSGRSVQVQLRELVTMGVLEILANPNGGRGPKGMGLTRHYRLLEDRLPQRPSWKETWKGEKSSPFRGGVTGAGRAGADQDGKGEDSSPFKGEAGFALKGEEHDTERVKNGAKKGEAGFAQSVSNYNREGGTALPPPAPIEAQQIEETLKAGADIPWGHPGSLMKRYNESTPDNFNAVVSVSPPRLHAEAAALRARPAREWWDEMFDQIRRSKRLLGRQNGHGVVADFDWLMARAKGQSVENYVAVHDGGYRDDR